MEPMWFICREVLETKSSLFLEDERVKCLSVLDEMKQSAHMYLLNPVHDSLKVRFYTSRITFK